MAINNMKITLQYEYQYTLLQFQWFNHIKLAAIAIATICIQYLHKMVQVIDQIVVVLLLCSEEDQNTIQNI